MSKAKGDLSPRASLVSELERAKAVFDEVDGKLAKVSEQRAEALGRLNEAQRNVEDAFAELKADAPRDSDWRRMQKA